MQIANCLIQTTKEGDTVFKKNVTPAELQILIHTNQDNVGRFPVLKLELLDGEAKTFDDMMKPTETTRSMQYERARLTEFYKPWADDPTQQKRQPIVDVLWPGVNTPLPQKFTEVVDKGGNAVYTEDLQPLAHAVKEPELVVINGKTYTKDQLADALAAKGD